MTARVIAHSTSWLRLVAVMAKRKRQRGHGKNIREYAVAVDIGVRVGEG